MQAFETLGLNLPGFLWHLVNFLILLFVLQRFLFPPVLKMLDERQARIRESMERAEALKEESARAAEMVRAQLDEARREAQAIINTATQIAERIKAERQQQAQAEYEAILRRAQEDAAREREQAFAELRAQIADLAVLAAGRIIRRELDPNTQRQLVEEFLAEAADGRSR
ncbi:MAG TPA: F0F1 ATP synthase subunit B [Chloroflexota bacterium]|jgi:F-type H+-transporting ATPase subunit b|nr:F0F1 ATP synthase subunit B [Chloroflexota bacterium]HZU06950.1 F0F1 ATP synthase subunit B [Chloroflexota bacterium]